VAVSRTCRQVVSPTSSGCNSHQVNLLSNAFKFTQAGRVELPSSWNRRVAFNVLRCVRAQVFEACGVRTTGIGIPPEKQRADLEPSSKPHLHQPHVPDRAGLTSAASGAPPGGEIKMRSALDRSTSSFTCPPAPHRSPASD